MMNGFFRHAARTARARLLWLAAASLATASPTHAADTQGADTAMPMPFKHYQSWRDEPLADWRAANDRVGEIGGWRTYLREAQQDGAGADRGGRGPHDRHGR